MLIGFRTCNESDDEGYSDSEKGETNADYQN